MGSTGQETAYSVNCRRLGDFGARISIACRNNHRDTEYTESILGVPAPATVRESGTPKEAQGTQSKFSVSSVALWFVVCNRLSIWLHPQRPQLLC